MLSLNKEQILKIQNNEGQYLMIDYADEVIPGKSAKGYKSLSENEWFFKIHWKNDPNMPGMLQLEALTQMASLSVLTLQGNNKKFMYLTDIINAKFINKVTPNTKLEIYTKIKKYSRGIGIFEGYSKINEKIMCKAEFKLILPSDILSPKND